MSRRIQWEHGQGKSHWDKLPQELKDMIFGFSSTLTLFLNGRLGAKEKMNNEIRLALWKEVLEMEWSGDLGALPEPPTYHKYWLSNMHLAVVRSREMYERLCKRLPDAVEGIPMMEKWDDHASSEVRYRWNSLMYCQRPDLRLLHIAMRNMWLDVLQDWINKYPYACANECMMEGHVELFEHLVETDKIELKNLKKSSTASNKFYPCMDIVAKNGCLDILKMLHDAGNKNITKLAMEWAAMNGHLKVVQWLHEHRSEGCSTNAMDWAAQNGQLHVVKWLHEHRREGCSDKAILYASKRGHLEVIKWLHENRREGCTFEAMDFAASRGHLTVVEFLHFNRDEGCTSNAMDYAARNGHLDVVEFLHLNRSEGCTELALEWAKQNHHLDVVQYLEEKFFH